jgi:hypothetical protein
MEPECLLPHSQVPATCPYPKYQSRSEDSVWTFRNKIRFYGEELLPPPPTPKLKDHTLSAVRNCLFNIFAATLHIAGRSSIRNLRTCHAVVTGTHWSRGCPETSAWNYHYSLRNNPEKRSSLDLHKLKSSNKDAAGGVGPTPVGDDNDDNRLTGLQVRVIRMLGLWILLGDHCLFLRLEVTVGLKQGNLMISWWCLMCPEFDSICSC